MEVRLKEIEKRYRELENELTKPDVIGNQQLFKALSKEHSLLTPLMTKYQESVKAKKELAESHELLKSEKDPEMKELLVTEVEGLEKRIEELDEQIKILLLPKTRTRERRHYGDTRRDRRGGSGPFCRRPFQDVQPLCRREAVEA
jgi:peptide chain release factor 1